MLCCLHLIQITQAAKEWYMEISYVVSDISPAQVLSIGDIAQDIPGQNICPQNCT